MMMTRKIGITPPPMNAKMSGTVDPVPCRDRVHDEPVAGDADHPGGAADRDVLVAVALYSWVWPSFLTRTLP